MLRCLNLKILDVMIETDEKEAFSASLMSHYLSQLHVDGLG